MLDNILNTVKRGAERMQRRGEEVASATRLRVEIFSLSRELDALYGRLGRSYHAGADHDVLGGVQEDIRRVEEEIKARERLIEELGEHEDEPGGTASTAPVGSDLSSAAPAATGVTATAASNSPAFTSSPAQTPRAEPTVPASVPHPGQEARMPDNDPYRTPADQTPDQRPARTPTSPDPTMQHSDERLVPGDDRAGVALEAERDKVFRHDNMIEEGKAASRNPDPLDK
ncbi:hypothetical protein [Deinococcus radiotolerans]|uniref:Uncharacterized protein n=1 Tax=Deinococcus radiotolerans TaxID=1309407 RepID=A0ABQ2FIE2_9DEIO|nr:hypothetical protein [Deinococcus radiotolerans]GGK97767.1 hypothetical protein GCM10010844_15050 [Deinococcus radiotolerans]